MNTQQYYPTARFIAIIHELIKSDGRFKYKLDTTRPAEIDATMPIQIIGDYNMVTTHIRFRIIETPNEITDDWLFDIRGNADMIVETERGLLTHLATDGLKCGYYLEPYSTQEDTTNTQIDIAHICEVINKITELFIGEHFSFLGKVVKL